MLQELSIFPQVKFLFSLYCGAKVSHFIQFGMSSVYFINARFPIFVKKIPWLLGSGSRGWKPPPPSLSPSKACLSWGWPGGGGLFDIFLSICKHSLYLIAVNYILSQALRFFLPSLLCIVLQWFLSVVQIGLYHRPGIPTLVGKLSCSRGERDLSPHLLISSPPLPSPLGPLSPYLQLLLSQGSVSQRAWRSNPSPSSSVGLSLFGKGGCSDLCQFLRTFLMYTISLMLPSVL